MIGKKTKQTLLMATTVMAGALCSCTGGEKLEPGFIGKHEIKIESGRMTPEVLWAMGRIGGMSVSPDNSTIAYGVSYYSVPENKSHRVLYTMDANGKHQRMLTTTTANEGDAVWIKGGTKLAFLSNASGSNQLWEMNPDGSERRQLTNTEKGLEGFAFSPDETKVILVMTVQNGPILVGKVEAKA